MRRNVFAWLVAFAIVEVCLLTIFSGCIVTAGTSGEDTWSFGLRNDNALVIHRRAMRNSEGKEEASASVELKINQGVLDAILPSKPDSGSDSDPE
jgi:hypothetical protein